MITGVLAVLLVISGPATVVDGDTIRVGGEKVRLQGIDTPERKQRYYHEATDALRERIGGQPVRCEGRTRDRYGRLVAKCHVGGTDLSAYMVQEGWAVAFRKYSLDYVEMEAAAQAASKGRWQ